MKLKDFLSILKRDNLIIRVYIFDNKKQQKTIYDGFAYNLYECLKYQIILRYEDYINFCKIKTIEFKNGIIIVYLENPYNEAK